MISTCASRRSTTRASSIASCTRFPASSRRGCSSDAATWSSWRKRRRARLRAASGRVGAFSRGAATPLAVAQEHRHVGELRVEVVAHVARDAALVERLAHAAHPRFGHARVDGDLRVAHAQPRVTVLGDVVLRAAEPADEEERERSRDVCATRPLLVARVQSRQLGLELGHRVVEALGDHAHRSFAAEARVRRVFHGGRRTSTHPLTESRRPRERTRPRDELRDAGRSPTRGARTCCAWRRGMRSRRAPSP